MSTDRKSYKNADLWLFSPAITKKCHASERRIPDVFILYMAMCMLVMCLDDDQSS